MRKLLYVSACWWAFFVLIASVLQYPFDPEKASYIAIMAIAGFVMAIAVKE